MNISKRHWYYITVIAFPLFFILHGVNEQFGLLRIETIGRLFLIYTVVAVVVAIFSKLSMRTYERATVYLFLLLCIYFFFGAVKDAVAGIFLQSIAGSYKVLITVIILVIVSITFFTRRIKTSFDTATRFIRYLLIICVALEVGTLVYNFISNKDHQKDPGDIDHEVLKNILVPDTVQKPTIVWIVMDEYWGTPV